MIRAAIDIGTNTFHLLIADCSAKNISVIFQKTVAVKLGEGGGITRGKILPAAYQRGLETLQIFQKEINKHTVSMVKATATAAVRGASNGLDFIEDVYRLTKIKVEIIDGIKEAEYIYYGAKASGVLNSGKALIMDIGGGSIEFIIASNQHIFWKNSYQIGAARLLDEFYNSDPLSKENQKQIISRLKELLGELFEVSQLYKPEFLVGTAGAFDSYKEILCNRNTESSETVIYPLHQPHFNRLLKELIASTHKERLELKGLIPLRVDMIVMASLVTAFVLKNIPSLRSAFSCSYALKEGLLYN